MERFAAADYYNIATTLRVISENLQARTGSVVGDEEAAALLGDLQKIFSSCIRIGLQISADFLKELRIELAQKELSIATAYVGLKISEISDCIRREMRHVTFLHISAEKAEWYSSPQKGWEAAIERFGDRITTDIEEACKCFACDRHAAAVFHAMLVAEFGVLEIGRALHFKDPKPSWHSALSEMRRIRSRPNSQTYRHWNRNSSRYSNKYSR